MVLATELAIAAACGQSYTGDTRGWPGRISRYACRSGWPETGPEAIYSLTLAQASDLNAQITYDAAVADLDLFLLTGAAPETCLAGEDAAIVRTDLAAGSYFLVIDGYQGGAAPYRLQLDCSASAIFRHYLPLLIRS